MKVLVSKKTGSYYYTKGGEDFHTKEGFIKKEDIDSDNRIVFSNTEREFIIFDANFQDLSKKIKRGPQIITDKDLGYIISKTRVGKNDVIVEAGAGSGSATNFFANIVKEVRTFEVVEEHVKIVEKNIKFFGFSNIKLSHVNLAEKIEDEKDFDMLFLDMPSPCEILEKNINGLKRGKFIVCYVPSVFQVQEITSLISKRDDYYLEEITEVILRHWRVWDRVSRPENRKEIDFTAFLVFIRKV